jgi:hypothetical protein
MRETEPRMAARESEERRKRLKTMRVLGFTVLTGGAVVLLVCTDRAGSPARHHRAVGSTSRSGDRHFPGPDLRVIEVPDANPPTETRNP